MDNNIIEEGEITNTCNIESRESFDITEETIFDIGLNPPQGIHSLKFNYNDQYIAAGYRDGKIRVFNVMTKNFTCELDCNLNEKVTSSVQNVKWRPKIEGRTNNILMAVCGGSMLEWHPASKNRVNTLTLPDTNSIFCAEYSQDGSSYALGCKDCSIRVYDAVTRKESVRLGDPENKKEGHQNKILAMKFMRDDPNILLSGGWDNNVLFWDLRAGSTTRYIVGPGIFGEGLDINCYGEILTASWRKEDPLQLWDYETAENKMNIDWSSGSKIKTSTNLYCCKFSKDYGRLIFAGGSQVNCVKIFDYEGKIVGTIDKLSRTCLSLDSSNDFSAKNYQLLALGGGEGIVRVIKIKEKASE